MVEAMGTPPPRTVLVVDDRKDVAETLAEMCRACGFDADVAEDGIGMLTALQRHRPRCVIVDVMMPGQDGYEALREIARHDPDLPVLLVTGHGGDWLDMGVTLGRAQGLTHVQTAAKPVRVATVQNFLSAVG